MQIDVNDRERELLTKILNSYLSELRVEISATKHGRASLHEEEDMVKGLLQKVSEQILV